MEKAKPQETPSKQNQQMVVIIVVVAVIAIVGAAALIMLSSQPAASSLDSGFYANINQSRTADGGFVIGDPEAPITIVEFADFLCPHCQDYHSTVQQFMREYVATGKARFEYRMLPVVSASSPYVSQLVECADTLQSGSFWTAYDVMFELTSTAQFSNSTPREFAQRMNLDYGTLLECSTTAAQVNTDSALANAMGVSGTPAIMVRYSDGQLQWPGGTVTRGAPTYDGLVFMVENAPS